MAKRDLPTYWGALDYFDEDFAEETVARFDQYIQRLFHSGLGDRVLRAWAQYHSRDEFGNDSSDLMPINDEASQILVQLNEFRNIIRHKVALATATEPSFQPLALNTDSENIDAVAKVKKLIRYYQTQGDLGVINKSWAETALVMSAGWAFARWDQTRGELEQADPETGEALRYTGDVSIRVLGPMEVAFDAESDDPRNPAWVICRPKINKYELAKLYPKHAEEILCGPSEDDGDSRPNDPLMQQTLTPLFGTDGESDYIRPYYIQVRPSVAVPAGRMALVLHSGLVLQDGPLPYSRTTAIPLMPSSVLGDFALPYGEEHDVLPVVDCMHDAFSTLVSGHAAQVQVIWSPDGADGYDLHNIGPFKHLQGGSQKPETLNLYNLPQEAYAWHDKLRDTAHRMTMLNDAVTGQANASDSGSKLAFEVSTSMQAQRTFSTELSMARASLVSMFVEILRAHMSDARTIAIVGKSEQPSILTFKQSDLGHIKGIALAEVDPMLDTPAGRMKLADMAKESGWVYSLDQWVTAYTTGRVDIVTDEYVDERTLILRENEQFLAGEVMPVLCESDAHMEHARAHLALIKHDAVRRSPELKHAIMEHAVQHMLALTPGSESFNQQILDLTGQKPLMVQNAATGAPAPMEMQPKNAEGMPDPGGPKGSAPNPRGKPSEAASDIKMPEPPETPGGEVAPTPSLATSPKPPTIS